MVMNGAIFLKCRARSPLRGRASFPVVISSEGKDKLSQGQKGRLAQHSMVPMIPC